jgi:hypothetical protein
MYARGAVGPIGSQLRGNLILIMLASDERFDSAARRQSICEDITTRLTTARTTATKSANAAST